MVKPRPVNRVARTTTVKVSGTSKERTISPPSKEYLDSNKKTPWLLTRDDIMFLSREDANEYLFKPAAERIVKQAHSSKFEDILDFYFLKYNLDFLGAIVFASKSQGVDLPRDAVMAAIKKSNRNSSYIAYDVFINDEHSYYKSASKYERIVIFRHELEHIIDWELHGFYNYKLANISPVSMDKNGNLIIKIGHHKHYNLFDREYSHQQLIKQAVEKNKKIPATVLKGYPYLWKLLKDRANFL